MSGIALYCFVWNLKAPLWIQYSFSLDGAEPSVFLFNTRNNNMEQPVNW